MLDENTNRGMHDFAVTKCDIISSDGKHISELFDNAWNGITLNESIGLKKNDPQFVSGEIFLKDEVDIFNEMKLVGDEVVVIKFKTPGRNPIEFQGRVYSVDLFRGIDAEFSGIAVKFCSPEKIVSDQLKFNRSYRNVPYSDIIKDLFVPLNDISKKTIYVEPTKNLGSFIVNNQSPIDSINKVIQVSRSTKYNGANYVFYESVDGRFTCASLEKLVDPSSPKNANPFKYILETTTGGKNDIRKLAAIRSFRVLNLPNIVRDIRSGMYSSTVVSNDLMKRKVEYNTFDYLESYDKYKSVNFNEISKAGQTKTSLTNNKNFRASSLTHFIPKNYKSFDTEINFNDERRDLTLIRRSQMQQMNSIQLQVVVSGDSERRVGDIVELVIPSVESQSGRPDEILSGRYLVSKIKHMISSDITQGYTSVMLLVKDSYGTPLPKRAG